MEPHLPDVCCRSRREKRLMAFADGADRLTGLHRPSRDGRRDDKRQDKVAAARHGACLEARREFARRACKSGYHRE